MNGPEEPSKPETFVRDLVTFNNDLLDRWYEDRGLTSERMTMKAELAALRAEVERLNRELNVSQTFETIARERFEAAETREGKLRAALADARGTILDLIHSRGSEAEGTDAEWIADIDAALSAGDAK